MIEFGWQYQCNRCRGKTRRQGNLLCVQCVTKRTWLTQWPALHGSMNPRPETQPSLTQDQLYGIQWTLAPRPRASSTGFNEPSPRDPTQPHPGPTLRGFSEPSPRDTTQPHPGPALRGSMNPRSETQGQLYGV